MTNSISSWIFVIVLLGVIPAIVLYIVLAPLRELKRDRRDILANGQAATGTIAAIDEVPRARYGPSYVVTVEFTPPGYHDPVQFKMTFTRRSIVNKLGLYQPVPIHYREQMPMEAVIDQFVQ